MPASAATITSLASSASSQTLLASDATRKGLRVFNDSTQALYVKYGATASATDHTSLVPAGGYLEDDGYRGRVDGVWASANGSARITSLA